jgi:hypothetical protein
LRTSAGNVAVPVDEIGPLNAVALSVDGIIAAVSAQNDGVVEDRVQLAKIVLEDWGSRVTLNTPLDVIVDGVTENIPEGIERPMEVTVPPSASTV